MAALAAQSPHAGTATLSRYLTGPAYGTAGAYRAGDGELHGQELCTIIYMVSRVRTRNAELAKSFVAAEPIEEDLSYDPIPPVRTYWANIEFVNIGRMPPMLFDYGSDE